MLRCLASAQYDGIEGEWRSVYLREHRRVLLPFTAGNAPDQTMTKYQQSPTGSGDPYVYDYHR